MNSYLTEIHHRLRVVVELEKRKDGINNLLVWIFSAFLCLFLDVSLEAIAQYSSSERTDLFYGFISLLVFLFIAFVVYPIAKDFYLYLRPNYVDTAKKVGEKFPEIKDELSNALQLMEHPDQNYSNQLVEAAFKRVYEKSVRINFASIVDFSRTKKMLRLTLLAAGAITLSLFLIPALNSAAYRLFNYEKDFSAPPAFVFKISPGNKQITKGERVVISIKVLGKQPAEISLFTKTTEQTEPAEISLKADSLGLYVYETFSLKSTMEYFALAENTTSDTYKISVINRPIITSLDVTIIPPAYSNLPSVTQKDNGNITALPGSKVMLSVFSSRELAKARIVFTDSSFKTMKVNYTKASAEFYVHKDVGYQTIINDRQNFDNSNPISYSVKTLTDNPPSIEMISPIGNITLGNETKISLISKISDDYGFSQMNLNYRLSLSKYRNSEEAYTKIPITISKQKKEEDVYFVWNLSPYYLAEGEALTFYLEIFDNDNVNGPKSARTENFTITVPSLEQVLAKSQDAQENSVKELSETFKEAERLQQEMKKISDDMKQNNREISWQEKERVEKAAEKFKQLGEKVEDISKKLSEMQKDLMKNNLLSEETLQKYNELQELMNQFDSKELRDALNRMNNALKNMMRDNVQMSMEELKANEEYFKKSIERTLNLLKRIQAEQKIDELIKRTEDITEKIDELKKQTEQSNINDTQKRDELSKRQKDISEGLKNLDEAMKEAQDKMNELKDMPKEEMQKLAGEFDKQNNEEISREAEKNLQQMQKQQATNNQQRLSGNMKNMKQMMKNMQNAMQQMNMTKTFMDMAKILNDLLELSKQQEDLKNKTGQLSPYSQEFVKTAREQSELRNDLNKVLQNMGALSQKTFAITPEMGKSLGEALSEMQRAISVMQTPGASQLAYQNQTNAMSRLNEAAGMLKGGMEQMMQGGQSGGMMSLMQQLQQMAQQQMNLNQITQMINQGMLSQEMMSQIQRLAQQQEAIRKSLEQLNQEAKQSGQSKRLASNLEKILNEMKEVVNNLQSEKVDDELIKQQEKILSKLIDAQRSVNERDYEENRKSNTGENVARVTPPELILTTEEGKSKLRDELQKAIREGYKKDYEDIIRKYFEAIIEKTK
jgi:predicted amino acid-binding ACT domain protein